MLTEILFVLLVLGVTALMAVDLVRTRGESLHGHAERQPQGPERAVATAPSRGSATGPFSPEPSRAVPFSSESARAVPMVPSRAAGPSTREMEATRAFDQAHRAMSRSAANEAELREKLNAMFVNLSHRSQSLVERQLRLIEDLEHEEQDVQRRANLSKLNRIAMRIHRNSQNLLVVAGHQPSAGWNQPVTLAHLVNAAVAEVEDYERVSSEVQPDIAVRGPAANDLVHLLVELIENATSFSAAEMPVHIRGRILTTGGALVEITDRGIGMTAREMAYANQRLDNPPPVDTDVPRWMGLLVVAQLAARHGIRIRLNQAESGGLTALVWLPDEILTHYNAAATPSRAAEQRGAAVSPAAFASARMNARDVPAARTAPVWAARSPQATLQAEPAARLSGSGPAAPFSEDTDVVVPHADGHARMSGPPIYDDVESRWSRGGRETPGSAGPTVAPGSAALTAAPRSVGTTVAPGPAAPGLPRRPSPATQTPRAVPSTPPAAPNRSGPPSPKGSAAPNQNPSGQDES